MFDISLIKDLFTIVFSGTAIILAILTYRRAKETFFQPVRSVVMKEQTNLLIKLLTILEHELNEKIDYKELVRLNTTFWLFEYGSIFSNDVESYLKKTIAGSVFFPDSHGRIDAIRVGAFDDEESSPDDRKKMYEEAKRGNIKINKTHVTLSHIEIVNKIHELTDNPFIPHVIEKELKKLLYEIKTNLNTHLRSTTAWVIEEVIKRENKTKVSHNGVFNEFNKRRVHHITTVKNIKFKIRDYLQIDSTPWSK